MAYARITFMNPVAGSKEEAAALNRELVALYREQPGCQHSYELSAADGSGEIGRMSLWDSEAAADAAATNDRSMFLRSRLHLLIEHGHQDRGFRAE
jgi:quinol monooxygenase YgiN